MSPGVIGANLVVSLKSFSREKSAVFFTIAFPIILILVFGTIFMNQDNVSFDLHVQDLDQTTSSAQLVKTLALDGRFKIVPVDPAINATAVRQGQEGEPRPGDPHGLPAGTRSAAGVGRWDTECGVP